MYKTLLSRALLGLIVVAMLWLVMAFYAQGQWIFALLFLVLVTALAVVFTKRSLSRHRYIFPALAGMGLFILFPLAYTIGIGFTNYSGSNLLSEERVREILLSRTYQEESGEYAFRLYPAGESYRLYLESGVNGGARFVSSPLDLSDAEPRRVGVTSAAAPPAGEPASLREVIAAKRALGELTLITPSGSELTLASLRSFAPILPRYVANDDGTLTDRQTGALLTPNQETGFFVTAEGERVYPGWTVAIGFDNYQRVLTDPSVRGPFLQIFAWTLAFSLLTVAFTLAVGMVLAALLQWDQLRGKAVYRTLLILPYAVPAFISILVFKGLFNQNFGEINLILESLFGVKPAWFSDPWLARGMLLIVNTWLGYPYMLLLCMGLMQSIPRDLYEASA
ncbi:MAG TPA: maltose ABC transporter permease MalF, partial [Modicisalibacter sp.]|nr:maltose ABC transporter permease MalF [Modicisalibacter sp.]